MESTTEARRGANASLVLAVVALLVAVASVALVALGGGGEEPEDRAADLVAAIDAGSFQAVILTSGAVYYAKVSAEDGVLLLNDVHYLSGATEDNPSGNLVKRGAEIHAPDGPMVLNPDVVQHLEAVGDDSVIARGIERIESGEEE